MYLYFESFTKNLTATILGLFFLIDEVPNINLEGRSITFLILTITIPSIISGIVTVLIEYFKSRRKR